ncbi:MAG TPA: hypothetical protein VJ464_22425 [Blastocatellia bacterium]|nr:hypothetical protein [Blastocatellia bacterium]
MGRLDSHSDNSITFLSDKRPCRADESLRSDACKQRGGLIERERARSARYCSDCAPIVRREQSRLGKHVLRKNPIYRKSQREYRKHWREKNREKLRNDMRERRKRRKQAEAATCAEEQRRAA